MTSWEYSGRSPNRALDRDPAAPRLPPTSDHHAGGPTPPDTTPPRPGRGVAGPGSTGPWPTPGLVPARTGRGRCRAGPHGPTRPARAGPGRSPTRPRMPPSSPSRLVSRAVRAPAFSRFVMIRPIHSARPRSGEHCFCAGQTPDAPGHHPRRRPGAAPHGRHSRTTHGNRFHKARRPGSIEHRRIHRFPPQR